MGSVSSAVDGPYGDGEKEKVCDGVRWPAGATPGIRCSAAGQEAPRRRQCRRAVGITPPDASQVFASRASAASGPQSPGAHVRPWVHGVSLAGGGASAWRRRTRSTRCIRRSALLEHCETNPCAPRRVYSRRGQREKRQRRSRPPVTKPGPGTVLPTCSFDSSRDVCSARCCWTAPWMATGASPLFAAICGARPGDLQLTVVPGRLVVALTDDSTAQRCMTAVVGPGPRSDRRTKLCLSVQTNKQHMGVCDKGRYSQERSSPLALARSDCSMFRAKRVEELLKLAARGPTVQARPMGCSDNCLVPPPGPELRPAFCPTVRHSCDSKPPGASLD